MTSKEALSLLKKIYRSSDVYELTLEYFGIVQKDIEVLEAIKRHCDVSDESIFFEVNEDDRDYKTVKKWYKNTRGKNENS